MQSYHVVTRISYAQAMTAYHHLMVGVSVVDHEDLSNLGNGGRPQLADYHRLLVAQPWKSARQVLGELIGSHKYGLLYTPIDEALMQRQISRQSAIRNAPPTAPPAPAVQWPVSKPWTSTAPVPVPAVIPPRQHNHALHGSKAGWDSATFFAHLTDEEVVLGVYPGDICGTLAMRLSSRFTNKRLTHYINNLYRRVGRAPRATNFVTKLLSNARKEWMQRNGLSRDQAFRLQNQARDQNQVNHSFTAAANQRNGKWSATGGKKSSSSNRKQTRSTRTKAKQPLTTAANSAHGSGQTVDDPIDLGETSDSNDSDADDDELLWEGEATDEEALDEEALDEEPSDEETTDEEGSDEEGSDEEGSPDEGSDEEVADAVDPSEWDEEDGGLI